MDDEVTWVITERGPSWSEIWLWCGRRYYGEMDAVDRAVARHEAGCKRCQRRERRMEAILQRLRTGRQVYGSSQEINDARFRMTAKLFQLPE